MTIENAFFYFYELDQTEEDELKKIIFTIKKEFDMNCTCHASWKPRSITCVICHAEKKKKFTNSLIIHTRNHLGPEY